MLIRDYGNGKDSEAPTFVVGLQPTGNTPEDKKDEEKVTPGLLQHGVGNRVPDGKKLPCFENSGR